MSDHLAEIWRWVLGLISAVFLLVSPALAGQDVIALSAYAKSPIGKVLFLRHALAPGNGDPAHFTLADCSSQRNLDAVGRRQSAQLGDLFRQHGLVFERVRAAGTRLRRRRALNAEVSRGAVAARSVAAVGRELAGGGSLGSGQQRAAFGAAGSSYTSAAAGAAPPSTTGGMRDRRGAATRAR